MGLVFAPAFGSCSSICRDSIVVSTLRCGRNNPGSNPGHGTFFFLETDIGQNATNHGKMCHMLPIFFLSQKTGLVRDLNPGPLAPKARIIPLDQRAMDINVSRQY